MASINDIKIRITVLADEAKAKLKEAENALKNLGSGDNKAKKQLDEMDKSATGLSGVMQKTSSDIKSMIGSLFAIGAATAFIKKLVDTVEEIQNLRMRLSGLTKDSQDYANTEAYLTELAHRHHKSVQDLAQGYSRLLVMEQSGVITRQQSIQLLEGFSNAQSKMGATAVQVQQSLYGLSQMLGQGTVQAAEFNQTIEPMGDLGNRIAKSLGYDTTSALKKAIGDQKITSEMMGVAMVEALQGYEGAAARSAGTISASYADVASAYTEMAAELEKPIATGVLSVTDVGKSAYGWIKDNGDAVINLLTAIAAVIAGKTVAALTAKTQAGILAIQVEQAHGAALIENAQREEAARLSKVRLAEAKVQNRNATVQLITAELAASTTAAEYNANVIRLTAAIKSQAAANQFLAGQNLKLAESQAAVTVASNASGVMMTRLGAAFKSAFAFVGGWVGIAVMALWGLYEVLNKVTGAEEDAERKAKAFNQSLEEMHKQVAKLDDKSVEIDFSKTLADLDAVNAKIKEIESFSWSKLGDVIADPDYANKLAEQRANLQQQKELLEKRKEALVEKKNDLTTNFDTSNLSTEQLNAELKTTQAEFDELSKKVTPLQEQWKQGLIGKEAFADDEVRLNALTAKLSAIQGKLKGDAKPKATDTSAIEAQSKAEEKALVSEYRLKEQNLQNAKELAIAEAGKDKAKRLEIEKDFNEKSLQLTLQRLDAEKAAKIKANESSDKKNKDIDLKTQLADLENQRLAALNEADTKRKTLGIEQRDYSKELASRQLDAQFELEQSRIDTALERNKAETKQAIEELKQAKQQGGLAGSGKFDAEIRAASKRHGFDYDAVQAQFEKSAQAHGIPADLLRAQVKQESSFNPRVGSSAGAYGFSQFLAGTAKHYGLTDRSDPIASIEAQAKMMSEKVRQYNGRLDLALAAYNGGDGGADYLARNPHYMQKPDYNAPTHLWKHQTGDYVKKIMGSYGGDSKATGETQLIQQTQASTQHFYEEKIKAESKGIEASINAVKQKLALAEKEYTAKKATATPEDLPKLETDYLAKTGELKQQLEQLNAELLSTQRQSNEDLKNELNAAKAEQIEIEEKAAFDRVQLAEAEAQRQLELGNINQQQFLEKQKEFEEQRYQIALKGVTDRRGLLDEGDGLGKAKSLAKETELAQTYAEKLKDINHKSALDSKQSFTSAFAPIKSAFSSTVSGIIQGTTTLKQGFKNMAQSIVLSFANAMTNMAIDAAAQWAWELMGFGAKETAKTTIKAGSETAQAASVVASQASQTASTIAGETARSAVVKTSTLSTIGAKAAQAGAGAFSWVMSEVPFPLNAILAPVAAMAAFTGTMMFGGMFSSAGGEWNVAHDRLNLVHKNETILPAHIAGPMREYFNNKPSYGLPQSALSFGQVNTPLNNTAASVLATQQALIQTQLQQQKRQSSGTVVLNGQGGDWIHKNQLAATMKQMNRNFKTVQS